MSNGKRYYVGNFSTDARSGETRGRRRWFVGAMMDEGDHRRTHLVEVKYWDFHTLGPSGHAGKTSTAFECTLILKGRVRATWTATSSSYAPVTMSLSRRAFPTTPCSRSLNPQRASPSKRQAISTTRRNCHLCRGPTRRGSEMALSEDFVI